MSNYGVDSDKVKSAKEKLPRLGLLSFIDPRQPWVLVPNGSLLGFFDWIPEKLRVGPWKPIAPILLVTMTGLIIHTRPSEFLKESTRTLVSSYPEAYTLHWWYNLLACIYMTSLNLWTIKYRSKGVVITYTVLSWMLNQFGHGINALAPFLYDHHILLQINRIIRFPALASASITCCVWNFVLLPYIHFIGLDTKAKRHNFAKFNFNFRLVQKHVCNVLYAVLNTVITRKTSQDGAVFQLFEEDDLWYGLAYGVSYGLFYNLVLDRVGVHLYPIFSPRSNLVIVTWLSVFGIYIGFFRMFNYAMMQVDFMHYLTVHVLMGTNIGLTVLSTFILRYLKTKDDEFQTAPEEVKAKDKHN